MWHLPSKKQSLAWAIGFGSIGLLLLITTGSTPGTGVCTGSFFALATFWGLRWFLKSHRDKHGTSLITDVVKTLVEGAAAERAASTAAPASDADSNQELAEPDALDELDAPGSSRPATSADLFLPDLTRTHQE